MVSVHRVLDELSSATLQMRDAACAGDWAMVARLQKSRVALIRKIVDSKLTDGDFDVKSRLESIREIERHVVVKAKHNKNMLAESLLHLKSDSKRKGGRKRSVDAVYGLAFSKR